MGCRCNNCNNIFVMTSVLAWKDHPEVEQGKIIQPLYCPYCGSTSSFSIRSEMDSITQVIAMFAREERC